MNLLELENVRSSYGSARVLHGVTLNVMKGERVALIGRNGVGKTTVVNTCIGAARLTAGRISFMGNVQSPIRAYGAARSGISIVPQGTILQEVAKQTLVQVQLDDGEFFRPLAAIYKKNKVLSPAMKQFITILKQQT